MEHSYIVNVEGAIWNNGRYLMIVRGVDEAVAAGALSFVGGKVEEKVAANDVLESELKREIIEETDVVVSEMDYVHSSHFITDDGRAVINIVFLCRYASGEPRSQDVGEVEEILWLTADEILSHPKTPSWTKYTLRKTEEIVSKLNW